MAEQLEYIKKTGKPPQKVGQGMLNKVKNHKIVCQNYVLGGGNEENQQLIEDKSGAENMENTYLDFEESLELVNPSVEILKQFTSTK